MISMRSLEALINGNLRHSRDKLRGAATRIYDRDYVASPCGRMLLRIGSGGARGATVAGNGVIIVTRGELGSSSDTTEVVTWLKEHEATVVEVESFDPEAVKARIGELSQRMLTILVASQRAALEWLLGT